MTNKVTISKYKVKNFLAERFTSNILQASEEELYDLIRYDGIKGFEQIDDDELYKILIKSLPEFDLTKITDKDNNHLYLSVKDEYKKNEADILVDIRRIIQMKMLS